MYMKQIKAFVSRLNDTFYNPSFYKQSIAEPREKAMSLLFWVNVLAASVFAVTVLINLMPSMIDFAKGNYVSEVYPDGLEVAIKGGEVSINEPVPYYLPTPEALMEEGDDMENLLVIDTTEDLSVDTIKSYNSLAVLTKDSLYFAKDENETRVFSLDESEDLTITEDKVISWSKIAIKWAYVAIIPLTLMMIGLVAGFSFVYYIIISFALTLIPLLIGKARKLPITYRSAYIVSLYALVPVVMIDIVTTLFGLLTLPFWLVLVIFTVVVILNLRDWKAVEVVPVDVTIPTS